MCPGIVHTSSGLLAGSFLYFPQSGSLKLSENFNSVFPTDFPESIDLETFLKAVIESDRSSLTHFLQTNDVSAQLFLTLHSPSAEKKTGPLCSAWFRIDEKSNEQISVQALNISVFMPNQVLYRDLAKLLEGLAEVRKITHDLNNQFQIITGYGSTLQDELTEPDLKGCAGSIVEAVTRAIGYNQDLRKLFPPKNTPQVYIPASLQHQPEAIPAPAAAPAPAPSITESSHQIMVVDDEPLVQKFLCDMLKRLKFTPAGFADARQALEAVKSQADKFTLAILDMNLPDMPTEELFMQFRELSPKTRIILISGENQNASSERMLNHGAGAYLQKPTSVKVLAETINRIIGS